MNLYTLTVDSSGNTVSPTKQLRSGRPSGLSIQANFTYGSGGTSLSCWVQTSFDGGATWCDVASFGFTTSSVRQVFNINAATSIAAAPLVPTDGGLAAGSAIDGLLGSIWRVKTSEVGTYLGTVLRVDAAPIGLSQN